MADEGSFDTWLTKKLQSLGLDEEVYLDYIKGVLEEEGNDEDVKETLIEIMSGVLEENVDITVEEICTEHCERNTQKKEQEVKLVVNPDDKIKSLMEKQQVVVVKPSKKMVDSEMKRLVLSQYQNCSGSEESDREDSDDDIPSDFKNVNAEAVVQKQQEERDKQKKDSDEKKIRDKMNNDKDKAKKEDRKEQEKKRTQKGERKAR